MKILQVNFEKGWRGGERQTLYCMRAFREAGHEVSLLAREGHALAQAASNEGFNVITRKRPFEQGLFLLSHARDFDIVHVQTAGSLTWAALTRRFFAGARLVFTRRTSLPVKPERQWRTLRKWRKADLFVAISKMAASEPSRLGILSVLISSAIEPLMIDQNHAEQVRQEFGLDGKKVIATSAALVSVKDPLTLIRAIARLHAQRQDFVFLHFGAGGDCEDAARRLIAEHGLQQVYHLAGFRQKVEDLYSLFDIFVMSSREEALGSSVLDAFQLRIPVVSTNAGGLAELLDDNRGYLCDIGDDEAMAEALARILDHPEEARARADRAWQYVHEQHDIQRMSERYLKQFEKLISRTQGTAV